MEVHQLLALRELRDQGSIAAAAAVLRLTPSAVSQQLAALQASAGRPLTRREGRRLLLTPAGERLASAAGDVADAMARARLALAEVDDAPDPEPVSVSAFHSAALAWFPSLLRQADAGGPPVRLRDEDVELDRFPRLAATTDLVIAHRPAGTSPWPVGQVEVVPLAREPLVLALRRGHPLATRPVIRVADLVDETWIAVHEGFTLAPLLAALGEAAGTPVGIAHRINEFHVAAAMVAVGDAVCLLPERTGLPAEYADRVALRRIEDLAIERRIDVLARRDRLERPAVRAVLAALRELAG